MTVPTAPRGIRNRNPLNIERTGRDRWVGMAKEQPDPRFVAFVAPEFGIRAAALILQRYQDKYGCDTIREMIRRWAPPTENDTEAYIRAVARAVRVDPDAPVDVRDYAIARPMIEAMIRLENGRQPYPARVIDEGLRRAGVVPAAPRSLRAAATTDTGRGAIATTASMTAASAVSTVAPQLWGLDWRVAATIVIVIAIVSLVGVLIWRARRA